MNGGQSGNFPFSIGYANHRKLLGIKFILNFTNHFFENIFQSYDAINSSEFITDQSHMHFPLHHLFECGWQGFLTGEQNRGFGDCPKIKFVTLAQFLKGVFHVNDTKAVIQITSAKRQTGVTAGPSDFQVLFNGVVIIQNLQLVAWDHNVFHVQLAHLKRITHNLKNFRLQIRTFPAQDANVVRDFAFVFSLTIFILAF